MILDFLARHPDQGFGLSELARRTGLAKPTCLGIANALADAGYLTRDDPDKTYRLGPGLISLGRAAQQALRVGPEAREQLRRLSADFATSVALSAVVDDRITVLELVAAPNAHLGVQAYQSYPFAPPVGLMFVLWDDHALADWLARQPTIPLRSESERLQRVIDECRADGYLVERLTPGGQRLYGLMAGLSSDLPDELRALLGELVSDIGERVYLRGEAAWAEAPRHQRDLRTGLRPPPTPSDGGVAARPASTDRRRDHQVGARAAADRRSAHRATRRKQARTAVRFGAMTLSVAERLELSELVHRYAYYVDARRFDEVAELFTADAELVLPDPPHHLEPCVRHRGHMRRARSDVGPGRGDPHPPRHRRRGLHRRDG